MTDDTEPPFWRLYDYTDPQGSLYEQQPAQHNIETATAWVLHLHVSHIEQVPAVLANLKATQEAIAVYRPNLEPDEPVMTGEYAISDWTDWSEEAGTHDVDLMIYFRAGDKKWANVAGLVYFAVSEVRRHTDWIVSTAGDFAEQLKRSPGGILNLN